MLSDAYAKNDAASSQVNAVLSPTKARNSNLTIMKARATRVPAGCVPPSLQASSDVAATSTSDVSVAFGACTTAELSSDALRETTDAMKIISVIPVSTSPAETESEIGSNKLRAAIPSSSRLAKSIASSPTSTNIHTTPNEEEKAKDDFQQADCRFIKKPWDDLYAQLVTFYQDNGAAYDVPEDEFELHLWLKQQKDQYQSKTLGYLTNTSELTIGRFEKLKNIGVFRADDRYEEYNTKDRLWHIMFAALCKFKEKTGHFEGSGPDDPISIWVRNQRWECHSMMYNCGSKYPNEQFNAEKMMKLDR